MIEELRQSLRALARPAGLEDAGCLPLGVPAVDAALGGGLMRGALHEIAAAGEAHVAAVTGFAIGLTCFPPPRLASVIPGRPPQPEGRRRTSPESRAKIESLAPGFRDRGLTPASRNDEERIGRGALVWIAEDMALAESGAPYGPGLETFGLAPERLLTVAAAQRCDLLWAMEEALRCRAVSAVIGEVRHGDIDNVALRRLSLAANESGALALLLRASPPRDASTAATRWIVSATSSLPVIPGREHPDRRFAPSGHGLRERARNPERYAENLAPGFRARGLTPASRNDEEMIGGERNPCFAARLVRNRRGPLGAWILQWSDDDGRFLLATPAQPVAAPAADRPHRQESEAA
jgi:protein ImuA